MSELIKVTDRQRFEFAIEADPGWRSADLVVSCTAPGETTYVEVELSRDDAAAIRDALTAYLDGSADDEDS